MQRSLRKPDGIRCCDVTDGRDTEPSFLVSTSEQQAARILIGCANLGFVFSESMISREIGASWHQARLSAYCQAGGNSFIERLHRRSREEEVWSGLRNIAVLAKPDKNIAQYLVEDNQDRPYRGAGDGMPREAFLGFAVLTKNGAQSG